MRVLGFICTVATYVILGTHVYAFFKVIAVVIKKRLGVLFGLVWVSIGFTLVYNIVFNHFLAMIIKPSGPRDLQNNEKLRMMIKQTESRKAAKVSLDDSLGAADKAQEDDRFEGLQKDVKRLMKYRTKTMGNLQGLWNRKCKYCNDLKPARTHHCSVCDTCVFQMSNHCVFTNNCVGLENQRYFLLFILYSWIGSCYFLVSTIAIWNHYLFKENHSLMSFLVIFDTLTSSCLFIYNLYCWFLACVGLTTIEFIGR